MGSRRPVQKNKKKVLLTDISDGIPCIFYFFGLDLALRPREVINPFPGILKLSFVSEDVIMILSILPNFNDMSKVTYL